MIDGEEAADVLSDDTIVQKLRGSGIDIARRTVAKYREAMRIPSGAASAGKGVCSRWPPEARKRSPWLASDCPARLGFGTADCGLAAVPRASYVNELPSGSSIERQAREPCRFAFRARTSTRRGSASRINARVAEATAKYFDGGFSGHVTIGKEVPAFAPSA